MVANHPSRLLDERETAEILNISHRTLQKWRGTGEGPAFHRIGRAIRYHRDTIEAFIQKSSRRSTSDFGMDGCD